MTSPWEEELASSWSLVQPSKIELPNFSMVKERGRK